MPDRPTRLQRKIQKDLRAIVDELGFNFEEISSIKKEYRTLFLQGIRVTIVRGVIVEKYVMLDERLSSIVAAFFFKKKNFIQLWRTKRFTLFDYYILEKLSLREKLLLVRAIRRVPKRVFEATERINAVRNVVAHNFFPETSGISATKRRAEPRASLVFTRTKVRTCSRLQD